jgi:hypothetical protein
MRQLMHERRKLFRIRQFRQDGDTSAVAHAQRGSNVFAIHKLDALPLNEGNQTVTVLAHVALNLAHLGKVCTVRLRHVEDIGRAEPD